LHSGFGISPTVIWKIDVNVVKNQMDVPEI